MPWSKNSGKGGWNQGGNQGPWGGPPPGGGPGGGGRKGSEQPPDLEQILRRGQERLRKVLPPGAPGGSLAGLVAVVIGLFWLISGFYQVGASQEGVVQRFGAYSRIAPPGLQWRLPWPIETHRIVKKTDVQQVTIGGARTDTRGQTLDDQEEGLMLTGDRNFLNVKFVVQFNVKNSREYLFNVKDPGLAVRTSAQSAMREVVGRGNFDQLQTEQRSATAEEVRQRTQTALDSYKAGIQVIQVNIDSVDPPDKALEAARDVQTARQEKEKMRNEAEAYQNKVVPQARGQAERIEQAAEAYRQKVIADAQGDTARFLSVYEQYKKAPDVTRKRMYLETMEGILGGMNKVIVDRSAQGVVPYLPLGELGRSKGALANPPAGPAAGGN